MLLTLILINLMIQLDITCVNANAIADVAFVPMGTYSKFIKIISNLLYFSRPLVMSESRYHYLGVSQPSFKKSHCFFVPKPPWNRFQGHSRVYPTPTLGWGITDSPRNRHQVGSDTDKT